MKKLIQNAFKSTNAANPERTRAAQSKDSDSASPPWARDLLRNGPLGLFRLDDTVPASEHPDLSGAGILADVDIVAVHGLNGDPLKSWTQKNGCCWIRECLTKDLPHARIYTFAYASRIFLDRSSKALRDAAISLLQKLSVQRHDTYRRNRRQKGNALHARLRTSADLVLALNLAFEMPEYAPIRQSTLGLLFFGTPHRGNAEFSFAKVLSNIFDLSTPMSTGFAVNTPFLKMLDHQAPELMKINEEFVTRAHSFKINCFRERRPDPRLGEIVVPEFAAKIDLAHEICVSLSRHHRDLARYSSSIERDYRLIRYALQEMLEPDSKPDISHTIVEMSLSGSSDG